MRARIVATAHSHFRRLGYDKTSVADVAAELGVNPSYIYKFFASKLAISEAVCADVLQEIDTALDALARDSAPAALRIERLYVVLLKQSVGLFFSERRLHDLVSAAMENRWASVEQHKLAIREAAARIIKDGVANGEFDAGLNIEEAITAVWSSLFAFGHPAVLESTLHYDLDAHARAAAAMTLRALARPGPK